MDDLIAYLIGIAIVAFLLYLFIVYVVLPILSILIGIGLAIFAGIVICGFVSGLVVGGRNFIEVLREAHEKLPS